MTPRELMQLMDRCGVQHREGPAGTRVGELKDGDLPTIFAVVRDGSIVQMRSLGLMRAEGQSYRRELLSALMHMNYEQKLIKFGFDPRDGEIVAYIDLYVGDSDITDKQLRRCIRTYEMSVTRARNRFQRIQSTGEDPGDDLSGVIEALLGALGSGSDSISRKSEEHSPRKGAPEERGEKPRPDSKREEPRQEEPPPVDSDGDGFDSFLDDMLDEASRRDD